MDIKKLQRAIVDGLEDVKAQDIVVFDTEHLSPLFERVIIASGTSNRQTKALASSVRETVKERGMQVMRTEGEGNGEWIIVDCGAAVVHVMQPAMRQYYHLEEIWGGKPVNLTTRGAKGLVKASEPDDEDEAPAKSKKSAAKKSTAASASKKAPTRATGTKSKDADTKPAKADKADKKVASKTATKTTAKKAAAAAQRVIDRAPVAETLKVGAKKPATKKAAAAKPVAKAAPKSAVKSATKPAAKSVTKPAAKATAKPAAKVAKPAAKKPAAKVAKPAAKKVTVKTGTKSKAAKA